MALPALILAAGLAGCGTIHNLTGASPGPDEVPARRIFGGVTYDAGWGIDLLTDSSCGHGGWPACIAQKLVLAPYILTIDLALSAVGDTLTLPVTLDTSSPEQAKVSSPVD